MDGYHVRCDPAKLQASRDTGITRTLCVPASTDRSTICSSHKILFLSPHAHQHSEVKASILNQRGISRIVWQKVKLRCNEHIDNSHG